MSSVQNCILITFLTQQGIRGNKTKEPGSPTLDFPEWAWKQQPHLATQRRDGSGTKFNSSQWLILNMPHSSSQPCHLIWMPLSFFLFFSLHCYTRPGLWWSHRNLSCTRLPLSRWNWSRSKFKSWQYDFGKQVVAKKNCFLTTDLFRLSEKRRTLGVLLHSEALNVSLFPNKQ